MTIICSKRPPMDATVCHHVCIANSSLRNESDELYRIHVTHLSPPSSNHAYLCTLCSSMCHPSLCPTSQRIEPLTLFFCPTCFTSNPSLPTLVAMQPTNLTLPSLSHHTDRPLHTAHLVCGPSQVSVCKPAEPQPSF